MNSIGIQAALIDEFLGVYEGDKSRSALPVTCFPSGRVPTSRARARTMASMKHPGPLSSWLLRIDPARPGPRQPDWTGQEFSTGVRALRLEARSEEEEVAFPRRRRLHGVLPAAAQKKHRLPVFILSPGNSALLEPYVSGPS